MSNTLIDREGILAGLRGSICKIVFTKSDGTERTLYGTLQPSLLPERPSVTAEELEQKPTRKPRPEGNIAVWDVEADAWKSFRIDSVIAFSTHSEPPIKH